MVAPSASRHGLHHRSRVAVIVEGVGVWPRHRPIRTHRHRDSRSRVSDGDGKCLEWNRRHMLLAWPGRAPETTGTPAAAATLHIRMAVIACSRADRGLQFCDVPRLCCKLGEGAMRDQGASCSPYDSALARRSCSNATASVRAHGPRSKARSTIRASPTMPPWRANIPAWPLRSARITSKPLIVA